MTYTRRKRHTTSRMLTSDVERTALGQHDAWQHEYGECSLLRLTTPARTTHMDLSQGEHVPGSVMIRLHDNERHEQREIAPDLHLPSFSSGEELQHSLLWEIIFRDHLGHWRRSRRGVLCEQSTQQQAHQQPARLASPPRNLIAGEEYEEHDLVSMEDTQVISTEEEHGR